MENQKTVYTSGVSFTSLLTLLFIALKLTGVVTWSWWLVLLPTLISVGFALFMLILLAIIFIFVGASAKKSKW